MILILVFTLINTSHLCKCHVRNFRVKNLKAQKFEPFNAMEWVNGSIPEVVEKAVKGGKVFVVVIEGENPMYFSKLISHYVQAWDLCVVRVSDILRTLKVTIPHHVNPKLTYVYCQFQFQEEVTTLGCLLSTYIHTSCHNYYMHEILHVHHFRKFPF